MKLELRLPVTALALALSPDDGLRDVMLRWVHQLAATREPERQRQLNALMDAAIVMATDGRPLASVAEFLAAEVGA